MPQEVFIAPLKLVGLTMSYCLNTGKGLHLELPILP